MGVEIKPGQYYRRRCDDVLFELLEQYTTSTEPYVGYKLIELLDPESGPIKVTELALAHNYREVNEMEVLAWARQ